MGEFGGEVVLCIYLFRHGRERSLRIKVEGEPSLKGWVALIYTQIIYLPVCETFRTVLHIIFSENGCGC